MYYVYILKSKSGELYKGSAGDLKQRLAYHNSGKVTSTKHGIPWSLVYYEAFLSKKDALREEFFLKSGKGRERIRYLFTSE